MINERKERKMLFNQCRKREGFRLINESMCEVHGKNLENSILYAFLEEWRSEVFILNTSYSERDHKIS